MCDSNTDNPSLNKYTRLYVCFFVPFALPVILNPPLSIQKWRVILLEERQRRKRRSVHQESQTGGTHRWPAEAAARTATGAIPSWFHPLFSALLFSCHLFNPFPLSSLGCFHPSPFLSLLLSSHLTPVFLLPGLSSSPSPLYPALSLRLLFLSFFGFPLIFTFFPSFFAQWPFLSVPFSLPWTHAPLTSRDTQGLSGPLLFLFKCNNAQCDLMMASVHFVPACVCGCLCVCECVWGCLRGLATEHVSTGKVKSFG